MFNLKLYKDEHLTLVKIMRLLTREVEHWEVLLVETVADWETCKVTHPCKPSGDTKNQIDVSILGGHDGGGWRDDALYDNQQGLNCQVSSKPEIGLAQLYPGSNRSACPSLQTVFGGWTR